MSVKIDLHRVWLFISVLAAASILLTNVKSTEIYPIHLRPKLHLVIVTPHHSDKYSQNGWNGGPGLVPAARLAVRQINNSSEFLPHYELSLIEVSSVCYNSPLAESTILTAYTEHMVYGRDNIVAIIGPACSINAVTTGELSQPDRNPLIQVTIATSPRFENRALFPFTFGTLSSARHFSRGLLDLFHQQKWTTVGVAVDGTSLYYSDILSFLLQRAKESEIEIKMFSSSTGFKRFPFDLIIASRVRVMIVLSARNDADQLLCHAYKHKPRMTYPTVQWVLVERTSILNSNSIVPCTIEEQLASFTKAVLLQYQLETTADKDHLLVSGQSFGDFKENYLEEIVRYENETQLNIIEDFPHGMNYAPVFYDAVWALALGLDRYTQSGKTDNLKMLSKYRPLGTKERLKVAELIRHHMYEMDSFRGASGVIKFNKTTGQTSTLINLMQEEFGKLVHIGFSDDCSNGTFIVDHFDIQFVGINIWVVILSMLCTSSLTALTISFHIVNIRYASYKFVKASSPRLNHLIFIGTYSVLIGLTCFIVIGGFDVTSADLGRVLCSTYVWFVDIGVNLIVATVFVKTVRIYRIFIHFQNPGGFFLRDSSLSLCVLGLILPVILSCAVGNSLGHIFCFVKEDVHTNLNQTITLLTRRTCKVHLWLEVFPKVYLGFLLMVSLVLSVPIRHVTPRYKTIKSIGALAFSQTLLTWIGYPLYLIAAQETWDYHVQFLIITSMLTGILISCLLLIFAPPIFSGLVTKWRKGKTLSSDTAIHSGCYLHGKTRNKKEVKLNI